MRPKNRQRGFSPNQISSITNKAPYLQEAWTLSLSHTHCVTLRIKTETESTKVQLYLIDTIIEHLKKKLLLFLFDKLTSPENKTKQKCAWYTQQTEPDQVSLSNSKSILEINGYSAFLTHRERERETQRESHTPERKLSFSPSSSVLSSRRSSFCNRTTDLMTRPKDDNRLSTMQHT